MEIPSETRIKRDAEGTVRRIDHPLQPVGPDDTEGFDGTAEDVTPRELADLYLQDVLEHLELDAGFAADLAGAVGDTAQDEGPQLRFAEEKEAPNGAQVSYAQTFMTLPVWRAGVSVRMTGPPYRVLGAQSSVHGEIEAEPPSAEAPYTPDSVDENVLAEILHLDGDMGLEITDRSWLVYRFDRSDGGNGIRGPESSDELDAHVAGPTLDVELGPDLVDGRHYVALEVLFTTTEPELQDTNWRVFLEPESGGICRLESFVGCVNGLVFLQDPLTKTGDPTIRASSSAAVLDPLRDDVVLPGLGAPSAGGNQDLEGEYVRVIDISPPNALPPTQPTGTDFDFTVPSDDFSAVNAYYNCDRLFRMIEEMGFDVGAYFNGTSFPIRVDHRVSFNVNGVPTANVVNAQAPGNNFGNGSDGFRFALVERNTDVGMAVEWRVTLHEFGHAILWDHLRSPNFRFAHSPGDSLAAILNDPGSQAPDLSRTFPWTIITRRHNRRVEDGWGWGGVNDDPLPVGSPFSGDRAGYDREQILSSTLFRYYQAIGGDHSDQAVQQAAARYAAFLIFSSVGSLSPFAPPVDAEDYCGELIAADVATAQFEGRPGRMTHKVMRWAFERQGLFQAPGAPTPVVSPGMPPAVDVFIDDGRGGGYDPAASFRFTTDQVWNRLADDGLDSHQQPVAGQPNFLFVRVGNRGTDDASGVSVRVFVSDDVDDRAWPNAWDPLDTPLVAAAAPIPADGETIVGPFEWQPGTAGPVTMMAVVDATGDPSNLDMIAGPAVAAALLAHTDNNIAGRSMVVDAAGPPTGDLRVETQPRAAIPDIDPTGLVSTLTITDPGVVSSLAVSVTILHTWIGDLLVTLRAPDGTTVELFRGQLLTQNDDNLIETFDTDNHPQLGPLVGTDVTGTWSLRVVDRLGQDVGTLERWSLDIERA